MVAGFRSYIRSIFFGLFNRWQDTRSRYMNDMAPSSKKIVMQ